MSIEYIKYIETEQGNAQIDYTALANLPSIPTKISELVDDSNFITKIPDEYITEKDLTDKNYADNIIVTEHVDNSEIHVTNEEKQTWNNKSNFSGIYKDLTDKPTIPTKTSQLTNDSNFLTELPDHTHDEYLTEIPNEYITESELNAKQYLTEHQDISGKADKATTLSGYGITDGATKEEVGQIRQQIADLKEAIPKVIHIVVGNEFKMYYKNVLSRCTDRLWLSNVSGIAVKRYKDYLSITATEASTKSINWKVYDETFNVLGSGTIQVIATENTAKTAKVLIIGDSTVTQSNAISQKLLDCFSASGGSLTLLGTRGTSPALHEGRAGWSAKDYCTKASDSSYTNPFYNNGFDFSYYMEQQSYSSVDIVVIQLGINDIFSMTYENFTDTATADYIQQMVSSIIAYNSSIKVIVNLLSVPNGNGSSFTETYGTSQIDFVNLVNSIRMSKALIEKFLDSTYVTISPNNCVLDATTDINDGVHPNLTGYEKIGQATYETINGIFEGSESGDSGEDETIPNELWDLSSRIAVVGTNAPATATRNISNSNYYHPCAYTGAWVDDGSGLYTVSDIAITENSLSFQCKKSAYGIFVPFPSLDSSKTYRFTVNPSVAGFRVYRVDYDSTGVYKANDIIVDKTTGITTYDFTPTEGYQQGICFACLSATINTICTFNDLSLVEVTE